MTEPLRGNYFLPGSARFITAQATVTGGALRITDETGGALAEMPLAGVQVSPRLGNLPRRFTLTDGASFETGDNDAADLLLKQKRNTGARIHRLEQSWPWAGASVLLAGLVVYLFVAFGIPSI